MGKHKDILRKLAEGKAENKGDNLDEYMDGDKYADEEDSFRYGRAGKIAKEYLKERDRLIKRYKSRIEEELNDEEKLVLDDVKEKLLRDDLMRVEHYIWWPEILHADNIEEYIMKNKYWD